MTKLLQQGSGKAPSFVGWAPSKYIHAGSVGGGVAVYPTGVAGGYDSVGGVAPTIDYLWAAPVIIPRTLTLSKIFIKTTVAASAGGVARFGFYTNVSDSDLYPASLILDSGQQDMTVTAGVLSYAYVATLQPGLNWFVGHFGVAAPTVYFITKAATVPQSQCLGGYSESLAAQAGLVKARAYGALPATFPAAVGGEWSFYNMAAWFEASA